MSPFRLSIGRFRVCAALVAPLVAVAGCTQPTAGSNPTVPTVVAGQPSPVGVAGAPGAGNRIARLEAAAGQPATFDTLPGRNLTVVASTASAATLPPSFRLAVGPGAAAGPAKAYALETTGDAPAMPYRADHTAANQALLAGLGATPPARKLQQVAPTRTLGSVESFWISNGDSNGAIDLQRQATLKRITDHALIYLDNDAKAFTDGQLDGLVHEFETNIYPREAAVFGTPPNPGVDGEPRVFIVVSPAVDNFGKEKGLMGYFWSRDALPNGTGGSHSNQKECLFMTDQIFNYPALTSFGTMAHEYQHLLNFTQKAVRSNYTIAEDTWLDEGMAMYAMEVAGYGLPAGDFEIAKDLNEFQRNPLAYSLTDWDGNPHHFSYGQNYLFVRYLVDRYGQGVIKEILGSSKTGVDCISEVLAKHGDTFPAFFSAWAITNLVSATPVAVNTIYNYKALDLAGNYGGFQLQGMKTTPVTDPEASVSLRPWGSAYLTYASTTLQAWHLSLTDPGSTRLLGAAIVP